MKLKAINLIIVLIFASLAGWASAGYGGTHCEHGSPTVELADMAGPMDDCNASNTSCDVDIFHCSSSYAFYLLDVNHIDLSVAGSVSTVIYSFHSNSHISNPAFIPPIV